MLLILTETAVFLCVCVRKKDNENGVDLQTYIHIFTVFTCMNTEHTCMLAGQTKAQN